MDFLLIVLLGGAFVWLWKRVERLEQQVALFEYRERGDHFEPLHEPLPSRPAEAEPARPVASVPLTRKEEPFEAEILPEPEYEEEFASAPEAPARPEPAEPASPRFQFDFEDIFGRRLPIWAGGITLAIAGVFLVRYSIEAGLLTPAVRVALAFLFGLLLLGGAEWAFRNEERVADERVRQSLAGAGLATLYAAFYLAGTQYGLVGQTAAFLGLAAVTAGAIALSFRFGLPCAVLGLVGGFAAPALVGGEEANLPLLSLYLGLVTAGLTVTGKRQARPWLSIAALVFGLGWGAVLLLAGDPGMAEILALGLYFVVLGAVLPAFAGAVNYERPVRVASAFVASVQLALLVDQGGYAALAWGLYLLLGGTLAFLAWRKPELRETSAIAAGVAVLLLAQWSDAPPMMFALVAAGIAAVHAGVPLAHIWRASDARIDPLQLAGTAFAIAIVSYASFGKPAGDVAEPILALTFAALAALPFAGAWRLWRGERAGDLALLLVTGALMLAAAGLLVSPAWLAVAVATVAFTGLFVLLERRDEAPLRVIPWGFAAISLAALFAVGEINAEMARLFGTDLDGNTLHAVIRWLAALVPWAVLAWREQSRHARAAAEVIAALLAYGVIAQLLGESTLAWVAAVGAMAAWRLQPRRIAAQATLVAVAGLWALMPLGEWTLGGIAALGGDPLFERELPSLRHLLTRIAPFAGVLALVRLPTQGRFGSRWLAAPVALVIVHTLYKHIFAIDSVGEFVSFGLAERTLWQALLLGAAVMFERGLPRLGPQPRLAMVFAGMALAHALWFSGALHNPLWDRQAVGPTPLANLVLSAGAVAIGAALLLRRHAAAIQRPLVDSVIMVVASVTALGLLRQGFAGSILIDLPMSQAEDLLRSLLGIMLALGFLFVGQRRGERSWRIGSLVLILLAVAKVFLWDAAGLEGLLRIASFMALGFSLIGIGWVYARQLRKPEAAS